MTISIESEGSGFHYIPVPDAHVPAVLRYVAALTDGSDETPLGSSQQLDDEAPLWSDDDIVEFANKDLATARNYRTIMDQLVQNVGRWTSIDELAESTGLGRDVVKAFRTQIYRHKRVFYPQYTRAPFPGRWGAELTPRREQIVWYKASPAQAEQWARVQPRLPQS